MRLDEFGTTQLAALDPLRGVSLLRVNVEPFKKIYRKHAFWIRYISSQRSKRSNRTETAIKLRAVLLDVFLRFASSEILNFVFQLFS